MIFSRISSGKNDRFNPIRGLIYSFFALSLGISPLSRAFAAAIDLILVNGKIFTSASESSYVEGLAIHGDRIVAAGLSTEIEALAESGTRRIDLRGRTVIPGINDAHNHMGIAPDNLEFKSFNPTFDDVAGAVTAEIGKARARTILFGWIGPKAYFDPGLDRFSLDKLAPKNPVILFTTGHAAILNSAALERFGILPGQRDLLGGKYERNEEGVLTGVLREYAVLDIERKLTDLTSDAELSKELASSLNEAAKQGVTSIQDMSAAMAPARVFTLLQQIPSSVRLRVIRMPGSTPDVRNSREGLAVLHRQSNLVTISGTKWMLDGTELEGTFTGRQEQNTMFKGFFQPPDPESESTFLDRYYLRFGLTFSRAEMSSMLAESRRANDQLILHVVGYPAAAEMLDAMEASGGALAWGDRRVRFEHGEGLFADLLPRVKTMGIIVVKNPSHLNHKIQVKQSQPLRSLLAAGIPVAFGSDNGGNFEPYLDIMFAVTHPDRPSEAISREQAVIAYTRTAAYA